MKVTTDTKRLKAELDWISTILPGRPAIPVLAGVKFAVDHDQIEIHGTDYNTWATSSVDAHIDTPGTIVTPGKALTEVLAYIKTDQVTLEHDGDTLHVTGGTIKANLAILPAEDYPSTPDPGPVYGTTEAGSFTEALKGVAWSAQSDKDSASIPELTCVHLEPAEDVLLLTATDRYQLAHRWVDWKPTRSIPDELQVATPAAHLVRLVQAFTGDITLSLSHLGGDEAGDINGLGLADDVRSVQFQTMAGNTKVRKMVDTERDREGTMSFTVSRAALKEAFQLASVFKEGSSLSVALAATPDATGEGGSLRIETAHNGRGGSAQELEADVVGEPLSLIYNAALALKTLSGMPGHMVRIKVADPLKATVATPLDSEGQSLDGAYVIMPLRK